jgi:outer membrane protein assembly factor BamD (BamD/ComL family)
MTFEENMVKGGIRLLGFIGLLLGGSCLHGAYLFKNGHFYNQKDVATQSIEQHYQLGIDALKAKKWDAAYQQFRIITVSFEGASLALDAQYYLGVCLYEMYEFDIANREFSTYLEKANTPTHLEDVYRYKLAIAQKLSGGAYCHLFGFDSLPKLQTGRSTALEIFDEVASGLPNHDLAATALLGKAKLLKYQEEFSESIEVYQTAIRRFPGSAFALKAYQGISTCYLEDIRRQPQNVDAIALAEINLKEIAKDFPQAKELAAVESDMTTIKEIYVKALYETAQLYERMSQPKAAVLYYHVAMTKFPTSSIALSCRARIKELSTYAEELHLALPS